MNDSETIVEQWSLSHCGTVSPCMSVTNEEGNARFQVGHYASLHCCRRLQPHSRWSCASEKGNATIFVAGVVILPSRR
jgi:hypothetical protein